MLNQLSNETRACLEYFQQDLTQLLQDKLYGIYLYGSIALGAYEQGKSDIDFIVLYNDELTKQEEQRIADLHKKLLEEYPHEATRLDGFYLFSAHAGLTNTELFPYPYVTEGHFHSAGHWDINHVTWWVLKNKGIALTGPAARELPYAVEDYQLLDTMAYNIHVYWKNYIGRMRTYTQSINLTEASEATQTELDTDFVYAILTLSRIYYTISKKDIVSKTAAGQWLIAALADLSINLSKVQSKQLEAMIKEALQLRRAEQKNAKCVLDDNQLSMRLGAIEQLFSICEYKLSH